MYRLVSAKRNIFIHSNQLAEWNDKIRTFFTGRTSLQTEFSHDYDMDLVFRECQGF